MFKILYAFIRPLGMTPDEVKVAGRQWGIAEKFIDEDRSPQVYIDHAPKRKLKAGVDHAPFRTLLVTQHLRPGKDIVGFPREDMAGRDEDDVDRVLSAILCLGYPVHFISSGITIQPHPEAKKQREALDRARRYFKASRIKARMEGKRRSGNMGGRVWPNALTPAEKQAVLPIWVEPGHGSAREREQLAGAMIGREKVPKSSMARWFDCAPGDGKVGPDAEVKPDRPSRLVKPKAKPRPKPKPKRKVSRGKTR